MLSVVQRQPKKNDGKGQPHFPKVDGNSPEKGCHKQMKIIPNTSFPSRIKKQKSLYEAIIAKKDHKAEIKEFT